MNEETICELARQVITIEANVVQSLSNRIDASFVQACDLLFHCQGRIVVMGIGKSGHIAKKIAATLASTGSPAFFIHPSEAKHGDMGMLTKHDVLLALSYSGNSEELLVVLPFIKQLAIPMIGLTGNPHSALARAATVHLDVSVEKEACPLGLAPTSSTTAALVMGDALAMVLLERKGFTKKDFALTHPGGNLGKRLLLSVKELMHKDKDVPIVQQTATLKDALLEMTEKKLGLTTVVDETGQLTGIFTDGDLRRTLDKPINVHECTIKEHMSLCPKTIPADLLAIDALALMKTWQITALVILNELARPCGVLHIHDLLEAGLS